MGILVVLLLATPAWPIGTVISRWYERRDRRLHGKSGRRGFSPARDAGVARPARPGQRPRRYWGFVGRLHYSLVVLAALTFVAPLGNHDLLGFRF